MTHSRIIFFPQAIVPLSSENGTDFGSKFSTFLYIYLLTQKATYSIAGKDWSFQSKRTDDLSKILNVRDKVEAETNQMLGH